MKVANIENWLGLETVENLDRICSKSLPGHCCEATLIPHKNID